MSIKLKPYPEYKDSGLPWLGKIPAHWKTYPHRAIFSERIERGFVSEQLLSVTITHGVIRQEQLLRSSFKKDSSNEDKSNYKLVQPGDLAYNKMRMWQGAVGRSEYRGLVSPAYIVVRPRDTRWIDTRYYHYLFRIPSFTKEFYRYSYGICDDQLSLRYEDFKTIKSPVPPVDEQEQIARFLQTTDRRIHRFIRAKRRLIELLNEQKQAIIHRAMTRGLDPNVRLKPSGLDWLGDVPEHWKSFRLKNVAKITLGKMLMTTSSDGYQLKPYLRSANIQWFVPKLDDVAKMWFSPSEMKTLRLQPGDILVSEGGEVGRACLWNGELEECYIQNSVHKITPNSKVRSRFLLYLFFLMGERGYFESIVNRVSIAHLTREKLVDVRVIIPPLDEQDQIIRMVQHEIASIDGAIRRAKRKIDLIREYRTRLIADVVTGKLDVRGVDLPALDEADVLEDWDECVETEETTDTKGVAVDADN